MSRTGYRSFNSFKISNHDYTSNNLGLREELKKATHALSQAMAVKTTDSEGIDFGAESPLNLFIQCFKEKYGLVVNPNDVAIFV